MLSFRNIALALWLSLPILLAGCETVTKSSVNIAPPIQVEFDFADERPAENRISLPRKIDDSDAIQLGDEMLANGPAVQIKNWLQQDIPEAVRGRRVILTRFDANVVSVKMPIDYSAYDRTRSLTPGVPPLLTAAFVSAFLSRPSYTKYAEINIELTVQGRKVKAGAVGPNVGYLSEKLLNEIITNALQSLSNQVRAATNDL